MRICELLRETDRQRLALPFLGPLLRAAASQPFSPGVGILLGRLSGAGTGLSERSDSRAARQRQSAAGRRIHSPGSRTRWSRASTSGARRLNCCPKSPDAWTYLGRLEMAAKHYPEALQDFEQALGARSQSSFALMSAGQAHAALGDDAAAESLFRRALANDNKNADAANQLGLAAGAPEPPRRSAPRVSSRLLRRSATTSGRSTI